MRCAINDPECSPGRLRRGLCEKHYRRSLKTGTTDSPRIEVLSHYELEGDCWHWAGALWANGYGKTSVAVAGTRLAHRVFYAAHHGPSPQGMDLDHVCRNRWCVNPEHLQPVSRAENLRRGHEARLLCENGLHDITAPGSTKRLGKECVECWRIRYRAAGARYREKKRRERMCG